MTKDTSGKTIYLGGCNKYDQNTCILASITKTKRPLGCYHEDNNDMLLEYKSMTISSPATVKFTDEILNGKLHFLGSRI